MELLGVSPAAASTLTGVFNQRFEALFPRAGALGCTVCHPVYQLLPQPPQVFSVRGFEALFPPTGILGCVVCLAPQLFPLDYLHADVGLPAPPAAASPGSSPPWLPISVPPTRLDESFFFNSLVVGLPYRSIFLLFFVFKFVVLLLVVGGGMVYLPTTPSRLEVHFES